jgi:hypothetical protein
MARNWFTIRARANVADPMMKVIDNVRNMMTQELQHSVDNGSISGKRLLERSISVIVTELSQKPYCPILRDSYYIPFSLYYAFGTVIQHELKLKKE